MMIVFFITSFSSVSITITNKLQETSIESTNLNIDIKARQSSNDPWKDNIYGIVDSEIDFKLQTADSGSVETIAAYLPSVLDYVQGSANPNYDDYQEEAGIETLTWNNFHDTITFKAKIVAPGAEYASAEVASTTPPYTDNDTLLVETANPLVADADGPYEGNVSEPIQFFGSGSGGFPSYSWQWEFGDGTNSNERFPTHTYSASGTYTPTLKVTDKYGYSNVDETEAYIKGQNQPPVFSDEKPSDGSTGIPISTSSLSITIKDPEGNSFAWTIETTPYIGSSSGTGEHNGTKTCSISGLRHSTSYTWYVNATDSNGDDTKKTYTFTTKSEEKPKIKLTPSNHDFGEIIVDECSSASRFTLTNTGEATATGSISLSGNHPDHFKIISGGGSFSLHSGASKKIKVKFCPTSKGKKSATLTADGTNCHDATSSLYGTGIEKKVDLEAKEMWMSSERGDWHKQHVVQDPHIFQKIWFHFKFAVHGSGNIPTFRVEITCYRDLGLQWWSCYGDIDDAQGGQIHIVCCSEPWRATPIWHTLIGEVDTNKDISETNEDNNKVRYSFTVTKSINKQSKLFNLGVKGHNLDEGQMMDIPDQLIRNFFLSRQWHNLHYYHSSRIIGMVTKTSLIHQCSLCDLAVKALPTT